MNSFEKCRARKKVCNSELVIRIVHLVGHLHIATYFVTQRQEMIFFYFMHKMLGFQSSGRPISGLTKKYVFSVASILFISHFYQISYSVPTLGTVANTGHEGDKDPQQTRG